MKINDFEEFEWQLEKKCGSPISNLERIVHYIGWNQVPANSSYDFEVWSNVLNGIMNIRNYENNQDLLKDTEYKVYHNFMARVALYFGKEIANKVEQSLKQYGYEERN